MSTLTHLSADDAAWAEARLADWSNEECGRHLSSELNQREGAAREADDWMRDMDPEQAAANAGVPIHSPDVLDFIAGLPPTPLGAKRTEP